MASACGTVADVSAVRTRIELEDGRAFDVRLWDDPARDGLWFADVGSIAAAGDLREVGPFASERDARSNLLARVERELGMVSAVRRSLT